MHNAQSQSTLVAFQQFLTTPLDQRLTAIDPATAQAGVLNLFHQVATTVPAYQAFLAEHHIDPAAVQTFADFQALPLITKENYLRPYPLRDRCWDGQLEACDWIAVSSGSTGQPTFWPRSMRDELEIATRFEQVFHDSFRADQRRTLAVVCFSLGNWIGGMFTASCCRYLACKGYPITVVTPGNNKAEIYRVIQELAPSFEQTVLLGYPPFLKDVVDSGLAQGIPWSSYGIRCVMAGEVFSEEWRSLMCDRMGSSQPLTDTASLYGTADAGVLGNETPLSIAIRRFLAEHPDAARSLFGESRLPTLVQYDPRSRFFETQGNTLLFSGNNGVPLIRYHIADTGGIIPYTTMLETLTGWGFDLETALTSATRGLRSQPFVYVFGRSTFTVSYFGANLYPENVTVGLEQADIQDWVTGKFVFQVQEDCDRNAVLTVFVELALGVSADPDKQVAIADSIRTQLLRLNSEFAHYVPTEFQTPQIHLLPTGDPDYFPPGVKHRYTR